MGFKEVLKPKTTKEYFQTHGTHHVFQFRKSKEHIVLPFGKLFDSQENKT
jgi:hypothetical protein